MNYFYDIYLNFDGNDLYEFYEWQKKDIIEHIKKIPLFVITSTTMKDFIKYNPKVEEEFLNKILNKTENSNGDKFKYVCLLVDTKTSLAIEMADDGKVINKSKLLLNDDLNLIEISNSIKRTDIDYKLNKTKYKARTILRQEQDIKKVLDLEIETLYKNKDYAKLKYLYYEWQNKENSNIDEVYNNLKNNIKEDLDEDMFKIYELIKLSYKTNR